MQPSKINCDASGGISIAIDQAEPPEVFRIIATVFDGIIAAPKRKRALSTYALKGSFVTSVGFVLSDLGCRGMGWRPS